jgi:hypothetical protein
MHSLPKHEPTPLEPVVNRNSTVHAARYWAQGHPEGYHLWIFSGRLQDTDGDTKQPPSPPYKRDFAFIPLGKRTLRNMERSKALKPDGIGLPGELPTRRKAPWEDIEIIVEAKKDVKDMVKQAATHASCSLLNDSRHFFALQP